MITYGVRQPCGASEAILGHISHYAEMRFDLYAHLNALLNKAIPPMASKVPRKSNVFKVSMLNGERVWSSFGTVQKAIAENAAYMTVVTQNAALQEATWKEMPAMIIPMTKPIGFPALKQAKALFLRDDGCLYMVPRSPIAGGTAPLEAKPINPYIASTGHFLRVMVVDLTIMTSI